MRQVRNDKGQTLVIVLGILSVFLIFIPSLVYMVRHEALWTVRQKKTSTAFNIAEGGADRAYWKILENSTNWNTVVKNGQPIQDYDGSKIFDDIAGGEYKVWITSTDMSNQVKITVVARALGTNEVRALEVIYTKGQSVDPAIVAGAVSGTGGFTCHWGPIFSQATLDLGGNAGTNAYPVKRAKLGISGKTASSAWGENLGRPYTGGVANTNSTPYCAHAWFPSGWYEWQAYDKNVPTYSIPFSDLKAKAQSQAPSKSWESGVFSGSRYLESSNSINCSNANDGYDSNATPYTSGDKDIVRYIKFTNSGKSIKFTGQTYLSGTLIIENGSISLAGGGRAIYNWPVPANAWKQYCAINTGAANEWPGDVASSDPPPNPPPFSSSVLLGNGSWPKGGTQISFHGFMYVSGDVNDNGGSGFHGILMVGGTMNPAGATVVYYDPDVASNAGLIGNTITRTSWKEILRQW